MQFYSTPKTASNYATNVELFVYWDAVCVWLKYQIHRRSLPERSKIYPFAEGETVDFLFRTQYTVQITCAEPEYILTRLGKLGITVRNVKIVEAYKMHLQIDSCDYTEVSTLVERCGGKISIIRVFGLSVVLNSIKKRFVLACGIIILLVLTLYIPSRIFFISVEGNNRLAEELILQSAEQSGLAFGASRKIVRSEKIKNELLHAIPDLKWVGINTFGCHAVITVLERDIEEKEMPIGFGGIYATSDGIVSSITVVNGTPLCRTGQAVSAGQLLISGYTDTGLVVRAELAEGEVRAVTQYQISALAPRYEIRKSAVLSQKAKWSLQIGKKQINLRFSSGNFDTGCGKIYKEYNLSLPGGFRLPISLIKESVIQHTISDIMTEPDEGLIKDLLSNYLTDTMIAGKILNAEASVISSDDVCILNGKYICEEMIGKLRYRESE